MKNLLIAALLTLTAGTAVAGDLTITRWSNRGIDMNGEHSAQLDVRKDGRSYIVSTSCTGSRFYIVGDESRPHPLNGWMIVQEGTWSTKTELGRAIAAVCTEAMKQNNPLR